MLIKRRSDIFLNIYCYPDKLSAIVILLLHYNVSLLTTLFCSNRQLTVQCWSSIIFWQETLPLVRNKCLLICPGYPVNQYDQSDTILLHVFELIVHHSFCSQLVPSDVIFTWFVVTMLIFINVYCFFLICVFQTKEPFFWLVHRLQGHWSTNWSQPPWQNENSKTLVALLVVIFGPCIDDVVWLFVLQLV
jgi:hypothetical protein